MNPSGLGAILSVRRTNSLISLLESYLAFYLLYTPVASTAHRSAVALMGSEGRDIDCSIVRRRHVRAEHGLTHKNR